MHLRCTFLPAILLEGSRLIAVLDAFLLTRRWWDSPRGLELEYWVHSGEGPARIRVSGESAVCFVEQGVQTRSGKRKAVELRSAGRVGRALTVRDDPAGGRAPCGLSGSVGSDLGAGRPEWVGGGESEKEDAPASKAVPQRPR